jgi:mRNA interferase RelE/StbE
MYSVAYRREARKALLRMQRSKADDIQAALARVAGDPAAPNNNLRPLQGRQNSFRLRVGDWRVSYTLDRAAGTIDVFEIATRGGAYR